MQLNLLTQCDGFEDYSEKRVMIPLSGGINSAAVLCWLAEYQPEHLKPMELHLYYSHFREHSPDTFRFVADCIRFARRKFASVKVKITRNSVLAYFEGEHMIPHPMISPCSIDLKIKPRMAYDAEHGIDLDLVGFVQTEMRRWKRQQSYKGSGRTRYPMLRFTDEDCFSLVKICIGWYPAIYGILDEKGRRAFTHNNCLPCKNMTAKQLRAVGQFYPEYAKRAQETADRIPGAYWGRDDVPDAMVCLQCTFD